MKSISPLVDIDRNRRITGLPSSNLADKNNKTFQILDFDKDDISDVYDVDSDEFSIYSYFQDKSSFIDYQRTAFPQSDIDTLLKSTAINTDKSNISLNSDLPSEKISNQECPNISYDSSSTTLLKPVNKPKEKPKSKETNKSDESSSTTQKKRKYTKKKDTGEKLTKNDTKKQTASSQKNDKKAQQVLYIPPQSEATNAKTNKSKKAEKAKNQKSKKETEKVTQKETVKQKTKSKEKDKSIVQTVATTTKPSKPKKPQSSTNLIIQFFGKTNNSNIQCIKSPMRSKPSKPKDRVSQPKVTETKKPKSDMKNIVQTIEILPPIQSEKTNLNLNAKRSVSDSILSQIEAENMIHNRIKEQVLSKIVYEPELFIRAMSSDELFLNPYTLELEPKNFWINYDRNLKFCELVNLFFRVNNTRISKFVYKLYNMLLITSKVPLFKAIVGVSWITNRIFSVNVHYFAAMINLPKPSTDAILNSQSNSVFAKYNFVEITPYNYMTIGLSEFPVLEDSEIKLMFHGPEMFVNREMSLDELDEIENDNRMMKNAHRNKNVIRYHSYPAFS